MEVELCSDVLESTSGILWLRCCTYPVPDCTGEKFFLGWFCGGWKGNDRCWSLSIDSDGGVIFDRSWSYCNNDYQGVLEVCVVSAGVP